MVDLDTVQGDELSGKYRRSSRKAIAVGGVAAPPAARVTLRGSPSSCATSTDRPHVPKAARWPARHRPATVTDDGAGTGIGDASLVMSFGENCWGEDLLRREDAAGMEMLSLARLRAESKSYAVNVACSCRRYCRGFRSVGCG